MHKSVPAVSIITKVGTPNFITVLPRAGGTFAIPLKTKTTSITDDENGVGFDVVVVSKRTKAERALVKVTPNGTVRTATGAGAPTDGMISITLLDTAGIEIPVLELPVTYIDDPSLT